MTRTFGAVALGLAILAAPGCSRKARSSGPSKLPEVLVALPVAKEVQDYEEFTGRTDTYRSIDMRARVTGYLDKVLFKEGADVKEGETLFEIDKRIYAADLARAEANLAQGEAHASRLAADLRRATELLPTKAIGREEFDKISGDRDEALAAVKVARAQRDAAKLNVDFCSVTSPLAGRISRQNIDPGNLVKADDTILTTIVSLDPVYVYYDVDERTLLRFRRLIREGKIKSSREATIPIELGLADEESFPHPGTINFVENRVDPQTGTLRVRAVVPNPDRLISSGQFARVRLPVGGPHKALLVAERALGTDQGQKFLYVVNDKDEVEYRKVRIGTPQGALRVVEDGLQPGDRVVVTGLQRVRPGAKVEPVPVDMPTKPGRIEMPVRDTEKVAAKEP